ncbi:N-substituted formamide deformylase precursor [bacterium BMS3Abin02]|nr:N-substituted formamide deformylase precursor [bacterium BMS3Abin02]
MEGRGRFAGVIVLFLFAAACSPAATLLTATPPSLSTSTPATTATSASVTTTTSMPATTTTTVPPLPADLVLTNGRVITADVGFTIADAVAITGGDIVAVGTSEDLAVRVGPETVVVELDGRALLPGFVDPHTHALQRYTYLPDFDAMRAGQGDLLAGGVTTIGSPNVKPDDLVGFEAFEAAGDVIVRDHLYVTYDDECGDRPYGDYYLEQEFSHDPELRQTVAGVKVFTDGGVCNAPAFSVRYPDTVPQRLKDRGFVGNGDLYVTVGEVATVVGQVDAAGGITVIHAIGDLGIRVALDGLAQANDDRPFGNPQRIDHNSATTLLDEDELGLYGRLGIVPAIFPVPWANGCDPAVSDAWRAILPASVFDVIENSKALRETNPGMRISWHGDAPSVPGHPLQLLFTVVSGGAVNIDTGEVCYPEAWSGFYTVPAEEAIRMMTISAAAAMGIDDRVGSIEVGKVADLVILAADPLGPDLEVGFATNRPLVTMIDGRVVFCDGDLCDAFADVTAASGPPEPGPVDGVEVTASSFRDTHTPDLVLDGSTEGDSFWSSGQDPPAWIQVTFGEPKTISGLRLIVNQNPPGDAVNVLEIRVDGEWSEVDRFTGYTESLDVLEWKPDRPVEDVEAFRVTTLECSSWPEWFEFEIDAED